MLVAFWPFYNTISSLSNPTIRLYDCVWFPKCKVMRLAFSKRSGDIKTSKVREKP